MLRVDVRDLGHGPVETVGAVLARDPVVLGLDLELTEPLQVAGVLEATGRGDYFWRGRIAGRVQATCRRCLREFVHPFSSTIEALFTADPDLQDDPSTYPLPEPITQVDVTGAVREELALSVSAFPLCRDDCAGLCPRCGSELNLGPCACEAPARRA